MNSFDVAAILLGRLAGRIKRVSAPLFAALALALTIGGCSSTEPPHSDYFLVIFEPAHADLLPEGRATLARAVKAAGRGDPREIAIKGYFSADSGERDLSEQRMDIVKQAFAEAGIPGVILRNAPEMVDPQSFARLGNGVVVQIERGEPPKPVAGVPAEQD